MPEQGAAARTTQLAVRVALLVALTCAPPPEVRGCAIGGQPTAGYRLSVLVVRPRVKALPTRRQLAANRSKWVTVDTEIDRRALASEDRLLDALEARNPHLQFRPVDRRFGTVVSPDEPWSFSLARRFDITMHVCGKHRHGTLEKLVRGLQGDALAKRRQELAGEFLIEYEAAITMGTHAPSPSAPTLPQSTMTLQMYRAVRPNSLMVIQPNIQYEIRAVPRSQNRPAREEVTQVPADTILIRISQVRYQEAPNAQTQSQASFHPADAVGNLLTIYPLMTSLEPEILKWRELSHSI